MMTSTMKVIATPPFIPGHEATFTFLTPLSFSLFCRWSQPHRLSPATKPLVRSSSPGQTPLFRCLCDADMVEVVWFFCRVWQCKIISKLWRINTIPKLRPHHKYWNHWKLWWFKVGSRVAVENHFYCGACYTCDEGRGDICSRMDQWVLMSGVQ